MVPTDRRVGLLFGQRVVGADGTDIGHVHDVRLRADGPFIPGFGPALRIEGLVVGEGSLATRFGLDRADVAGPWPLSALGRRAARRAHFVPWETIERHETHITTTHTRADVPKAYP